MMRITEFITSAEWVAAGVTILLLVVAFLAYRTSVNAVRAVAFSPRHEVYLEVKNFIQYWATHARPQKDKIDVLDKALEGARFLFSPKVVRYLEKLREAALAADWAEQIAAGKVAGDKQKARDKSVQLCTEWAKFDKLQSAFLHDMKLLRWPR